MLEDIYASGKARAIGVSNMHPHHLEKLLKNASVIPAVNQFECHPFLQQDELIEYCRRKGILCQAYSPLGGHGGTVLEEPLLIRIAQKYAKTPAQVVIRWHLQRGIIVIPKSVHQERIAQNAQVFDFELTVEEMEEIMRLNRNHRFNDDPDHFNF